MGKEQLDSAPAKARSRMLLRGESTVASIGLALAFILLCAVGASAWWAVRTHRVSAHNAEVQRLQAVVSMLVNSAESMLNTEELSSLRRLVADTAREHNLSTCTIKLPDGRVLASSDFSNVPAGKLVMDLPKSWSAAGNPLNESETISDRSMSVDRRLTVVGHGVAQLHVQAPIDVSLSSFWEVQAGLGVIGAGAMIALLAVYRHSRARLRAVGAIREALLAIQAGEGASGALAISSDLGAEASAWNQILSQSEKLKHDEVAERARESLGDRRRGKSDLDEACDAMAQGIVLIDDKMRCKYANGAAGVFLQTERNQLAGADVREFVKNDTVKDLLDRWADGAVRQRTTIEAERGDTQLGDGGVLRWSLRPVRREDSGAAMLVIEDITQQRVAEEARHAFVAHATHELRTPLTNIRLYIETALDEGENDAILRCKCLNVINSESRRLERIVKDLLSTAEIEAGSFTIQRDDVHLDELFTELAADYEAQAAEKKIDLKFNLPPKLPVIQADRDMVVLALHNLISNALKYTPTGGSVQINVEADENQLHVDVVDTGIGIDEADQQRLFEKFYRAQDKRIASITGSGLGLALAREVVRLHGGDINVQSKIDEGSTFSMTIPGSADAA